MMLGAIERTDLSGHLPAVTAAVLELGGLDMSDLLFWAAYYIIDAIVKQG